MHRTALPLTAAALLLTLGVGVLVGRAMATGAPVLTPLTYGGVVTDSAGKPYLTAQDVTVRFYDKLDATVPKCTSATVQAEAASGRFSVVLPADCVQAVHDSGDVWSEVTVGAGKTVLPRAHVGALPYALEADVAGKAGGALKATIDALAKDVVALKAAPAGGGGGGPYVVDANGVKLGKLLTVEEPLTYIVSNDGDWLGIEQFVVGTSGGYFLRTKLDGAMQDEMANLYFTEGNCAGLAVATFKTNYVLSLQLSVHHAYRRGDTFYALDHPPNALPVKAGSTAVNSVLSPGAGAKCTALAKPLQIAGFPVHGLTLAEVGLPSTTLAGPLAIAP